MINVDKGHFLHAALEIGQNGENDTLPYDIDAAFIKEQHEKLAEICIILFNDIESRKVAEQVSFMNGLTVASERLLVPSGSHGFRITAKIHPFWNLYLNGLGLAIAEANEPNRSSRVHSYRLSSVAPEFFDRSRTWRFYKEATLTETILVSDQTVVIQTDIASFYERIYHHRLENIVKDLATSSSIALQIDRMLNKLAAGRSFGLPVGDNALACSQR